MAVFHIDPVSRTHKHVVRGVILTKSFEATLHGLLFKRAPGDAFAGQWENAGGGADGQSHQRAIRREIHEESGLELVRIGPLLHAQKFKGFRNYYTECTYLVKVRGQVEISDEHDDVMLHRIGNPLPEAMATTAQLALAAAIPSPRLEDFLSDVKV